MATEPVLSKYGKWRPQSNRPVVFTYKLNLWINVYFLISMYSLQVLFVILFMSVEHRSLGPDPINGFESTGRSEKLYYKNHRVFIHLIRVYTSLMIMSNLKSRDDFNIILFAFDKF